MKETTIEVATNNGFLPGDDIGVTTFDMRWWKRLWYFITFRQSPKKTEYFKVTEVHGSHTINII